MCFFYFWKNPPQAKFSYKGFTIEPGKSDTFEFFYYYFYPSSSERRKHIREMLLVCLSYQEEEEEDQTQSSSIEWTIARILKSDVKKISRPPLFERQPDVVALRDRLAQRTAERIYGETAQRTERTNRK